jgi:ataxin-3
MMASASTLSRKWRVSSARGWTKVGTIFHTPPFPAGLCGVHCVNTLLQSPVVSAPDLAEIAQGLDAQERVAMAEEGVESADFLRYMAEDSGNVAGDGNFSVQVLSEALKVWNLEVVSVTSPDAKEAKANPLQQNAFILNLGDHWFTVRKIGGAWWNLNSLNKSGPEEIGDFYLSLLFDTLQSQGYAICVVFGDLPDFRGMMNDSFSSGGGKWVTCYPKKKGGGGGGRGGGGGQHNNSGDDLQKAIKASLMQEDDEDAEMAAAIAASLTGAPAVSAPAPAPAASAPTDEADERAVALSRALSAPEPQAGSAGAYVLQVRVRGADAPLKRSWEGGAPLSVVYDYVVGSVPTARRDGVLRDAGDAKKTYPSSNQSVREVFGSTKRVALIFE